MLEFPRYQYEGCPPLAAPLANAWVWAGVIGTAAIWILIIALTPVAVRRLPRDCFVNDDYFKFPGKGERGALFWIKVLFRNIAGAALVLIGTVGLQGVLIVMLGLGIMDIPGKAKCVRWLAKIGFVWRTMARIREKAGLEPLAKPE